MQEWSTLKISEIQPRHSGTMAVINNYPATVTLNNRDLISQGPFTPTLFGPPLDYGPAQTAEPWSNKMKRVGVIQFWIKLIRGSVFSVKAFFWMLRTFGRISESSGIRTRKQKATRRNAPWSHIGRGERMLNVNWSINFVKSQLEKSQFSERMRERGTELS